MTVRTIWKKTMNKERAKCLRLVRAWFRRLQKIDCKGFWTITIASLSSRCMGQILWFQRKNELIDRRTAFKAKKSPISQVHAPLKPWGEWKKLKIVSHSKIGGIIWVRDFSTNERHAFCKTWVGQWKIVYAVCHWIARKEEESVKTEQLKEKT